MCIRDSTWCVWSDGVSYRTRATPITSLQFYFHLGHTFSSCSTNIFVVGCSCDQQRDAFGLCSFNSKQFCNTPLLSGTLRTQRIGYVTNNFLGIFINVFLVFIFSQSVFLVFILFTFCLFFWLSWWIDFCGKLFLFEYSLVGRLDCY